MKATMNAVLFVLFLGLSNPALGRAAASAHPPVTLASGLDMSRATIPVDVNGRHYACVLDTGTSAILVSQSIAQTVGLDAEAPVDEVSPDGLRYADRHTHLARLDVAGFAMRDLPAMISSKLRGNTMLCGYDFFVQIPTLIDRDRQAVTLFPTVATLDQMRCLPVDLTARVPIARLLVDGAWVDDIVFDSGMIGGGAIWNGAVSTLPPAPPDSRLACGYSATIGLFEGLPPNHIPLCTSSQRPDGHNGIVETNLPNVHALAVDYPNRRLCFSI